MAERKRVLFLCVHNSVRSILAEYLVNHLRGEQFIAQSAGLEASGVNPYTIRVLQEIGVDASGARSKRVDELRGENFDLVVTVCGESEGECHVWLGAGTKVHLPFEDPGKVQGTEAEVLAAFRAVRDEMRTRLLPRLDEYV